MIRAAIFDLDGTILDTAEDLALSMNYAMGVTGHKSNFTKQDANLLFGSGVYVAIRRALAMENGVETRGILNIGTAAEGEIAKAVSTETERIRTRFTPYYNMHCKEHTGPFPGIPGAVAALGRRGIKTAVVSNKPDAAVQILAADHFGSAFDFVIGERPEMKRKPAPDMVFQCLRELGVSAEEAVYIGDTEIDLQTAEAAGMRCIAVTWGFRDEQALKESGAKTIARSAEELLLELLEA